jgi:hypothetical protein
MEMWVAAPPPPLCLRVAPAPPTRLAPPPHPPTVTPKKILERGSGVDQNLTF